jgi:hypothetical protein
MLRPGECRYSSPGCRWIRIGFWAMRACKTRNVSTRLWLEVGASALRVLAFPVEAHRDRVLRSAKARLRPERSFVGGRSRLLAPIQEEER